MPDAPKESGLRGVEPDKKIEVAGPSFPDIQDRLEEIPEGKQILDAIIKNLKELTPSEREKMEKELRSIPDDILDRDLVTLLKSKQKRLEDVKMVTQESIVGNKETIVDKKETALDNEKTLVNNEKTETTIDGNGLKKLEQQNELADKRIQALYDSFGKPGEFERLNPDLKKWHNEAKKNLDPNDPNIDRKAMLKALHEHKSEIDTNAQKLSPELLKKYESRNVTIFRDIESSLLEFGIKDEHPSIPKYSGPAIDGLLIDHKPGDKITRTGNEFRSGDQIVDVGTYPPTRQTEQFGLRAGQSGERFERLSTVTNAYNETQKDRNEKITELKQSEILSNRKDQNTLSGITKTVKLEPLTEATYGEIIQELNQRKSEEMPGSKEIETINQRIEHVTKMKEEFISRSADISLKIQIIEQQIIKDKGKYQAFIREFAESERHNLRFIHHLGLNALGQGGINTLLNSLNTGRETRKEHPLSLGERFSTQDETALTRALQKNLGEEGKGLFKEETGKTTLSEKDGIRKKIIDLLTAKGLNGNLSDPTEKIKKNMEGLNENTPVTFEKSQDKEKSKSEIK